MARNGLLALSDAFCWTDTVASPCPTQHISDAVLDRVVLCALEQAATDKSFLRHAAETALRHIASLSVKADPAESRRVFIALAKHARHLRPRIPAVVSKFCLQWMHGVGTARLRAQSAPAIQHILATFATLQSGRDAAGRDSARAGLKACAVALGAAAFEARLRAAVPSTAVAGALRAAGVRSAGQGGGTRRMSLKERIRAGKLAKKKHRQEQQQQQQPHRQ